MIYNINLTPDLINVKLIGYLIIYIGFSSLILWGLSVLNGFIEPKEKTKK